MDFFVPGFAYPKHKAGGAIEQAERWSQTIFETTKDLPIVKAPCRMKIHYNISPERFTLGAPYGPDLDNLTKRLLDDLKRTILREAAGEDGCILELTISKSVAALGEPSGAKVSIESIQEGIGTGEFLYFAYGSNMSLERLQGRVTTLKKICNAFLPNYLLRTNKKGDDGSGKANVEQGSSSDVVWGVLWSIPETSRAKLDEKEGFYPGRHDSHYRPDQILVFDESKVPWRAMTYVACQGRTTDEDLHVQDWYYDFICSGAVENGLPTDYVDMLKQIRKIA
jgi:Holliday junction resolvase RusA-like endonuclease